MNCSANKRTISLIVLNSALLATGVLLIIFSCVLFHNWWPICMIFLFLLSSFFPLLFGGCQLEENDYDHDEIGPMLGWFMVGLFLVLGFSIPMELVRKGLFEWSGFGMTTSGGVIILTAIVLFIKILFY